MIEEISIDASKLLSNDVGEKEIYKINSNINSADESKLSNEISGRVSLTNLGESILAEFTIETEINQVCSRCSKDFSLPITLDYKQVYKSNPSDDEFPISGENKIDLWPSIRQEIILNIPMKPLCRDNCEGFKD